LANKAYVKTMENTFSFHGTAFSFFWLIVRNQILVFITVGLYIPWAICNYAGWVARHTEWQGKRLHFHGTGGQIFKRWLFWTGLTGITAGIYAFWFIPNMYGWIMSQTTLAEES